MRTLLDKKEIVILIYCYIVETHFEFFNNITI